MGKSTLTGKVAFITGGASGIGKAIAEEMASRGAEVVLADRQIELAQEVARGLLATGAKASALELDVRDGAAFERAAQTIVRRSGRIDYLFNNAGIAVGGEILDYERSDWDDVFDVNLRGVAYGVSAVYPHMVAQKSGHIVNTASVAGLVSAPGTASYCAAKHAVVGLTKALRVEGARHGVRASVLCPGAIRTPILTGGRYGRTRFRNVSTDMILAQWEKVRPMDPAVLAKKTVDDMLDNVAIIVHPKWWKAMWYLDRLSPTLAMSFWGRTFQRLRQDFRQSDADRTSRPVAPEPPASSPRAVS